MTSTGASQAAMSDDPPAGDDSRRAAAGAGAARVTVGAATDPRGVAISGRPQVGDRRVDATRWHGHGVRGSREGRVPVVDDTRECVGRRVAGERRLDDAKGRCLVVGELQDVELAAGHLLRLARGCVAGVVHVAAVGQARRVGAGRAGQEDGTARAVGLRGAGGGRTAERDVDARQRLTRGVDHLDRDVGVRARGQQGLLRGQQRRVGDRGTAVVAVGPAHVDRDSQVGVVHQGAAVTRTRTVAERQPSRAADDAVRRPVDDAVAAGAHRVGIRVGLRAGVAEAESRRVRRTEQVPRVLDLALGQVRGGDSLATVLRGPDGAHQDGGDSPGRHRQQQGGDDDLDEGRTCVPRRPGSLCVLHHPAQGLKWFERVAARPAMTQRPSGRLPGREADLAVSRSGGWRSGTATHPPAMRSARGLGRCLAGLAAISRWRSGWCNRWCRRRGRHPR